MCFGLPGAHELQRGRPFFFIVFQKIARRLCEIEGVVGGLLVAGSMLFTGALPWALGVFAVYWGLRKLAWNRFSVRTPLDAGNVVLLGLLPLNYWASSRPEISGPQLWRLAVGIGWYYSIVNWVESGQAGGSDSASARLRRLRLLWEAVVLGAAMLAGYSLISVEWDGNKLGFLPESVYAFAAVLTPDSVHPNVMAGSLVLFLPVLFSRWMFSFSQRCTQWGFILLYASCLLIVAGFLVLTQSRGALLAAFLALAAATGLQMRKGRAAGALILLGGAALGWHLGFRSLLGSLFAGAPFDGLADRLQIWQRAVYIIQDFPFTGVGMGLFEDALDALYPIFEKTAEGIPHAHQLFLQIAVDLGLPGFAAWFFGYWLAGHSAWRVWRLGRERQDYFFVALGAGLLGSQVALTAHGLMDAVVWGMVKPAPFVWGLWAVIVAARRAAERFEQPS